MQVNARPVCGICSLLVVFQFWLAYKVIDQAVTIDHQSQRSKGLIEQRDLLVLFVNYFGIGLPELKVRSLIGSLASNDSFEKKDGELVAGQISFFFKEGKLLRVEVNGE